MSKKQPPSPPQINDKPADKERKQIFKDIAKFVPKQVKGK